MQEMIPEPPFRTCCSMGVIYATMYLSVPSGSPGTVPSFFPTTLPVALTANEGKGMGLSAIASPVLETSGAVSAVGFAGTAPVSAPMYVPTGAELAGSKRSAQVKVAADIWTMLLQGTIILMPLTVIVPPASLGDGAPIAGSTGGVQMRNPVSRVASWMNPVKANWGVGGVNAQAPVAQSSPKPRTNVVMSSFRMSVSFPIVVC